MAKYRFTPVVYASMPPIEVEADSKEDALDKAMEKFESQSLCWQCSNHFDVGDVPIDSIEYIDEVEN